MADPNTSNIALLVPTRGSDVGTWDVPLNGNATAIDGYFGGVQIISATNAPITLTAPAGAIAPSGGPTQAQNAVLSFTGALTSNVQVTLPLPGYYIVENLTTGAFVLTFAAAAAGQVIAVDQGECQHIYNNGTNVRFVNLGRLAVTEIWAGLSALPAWVNACTVPPYLLCDGTVYNISAYPYLGARLGKSFGGDGSSTFGVPDLRGRIPLIYDGTGTRITTAGSGLNGQTMGAVLDQQTVTLTAAQIPEITSNVQVSVSGGVSVNTNIGVGGGTVAGINTSFLNGVGSQNWPGSGSFSGSGSGAAQSNNTANQAHPNVQPSQVTGIAVIRAA